MSSKICVRDGCESEVTIARMCAELVKQGVEFEVHLMPGAIGGQWWEITFTGGY